MQIGLTSFLIAAEMGHIEVAGFLLDDIMVAAFLSEQM